MRRTLSITFACCRSVILALLAVGILSPSAHAPLQADIQFANSRGGTSGAKIYKLVRTFSIAEVLTLNTSPIEILPARSGYVYAGDTAVFMRDGQRYLTWPGNLQIRVKGAAALIHFAATPASIGTGSTTVGGANGAASFGVTMAAAGGADDAATSFGSKGLEVFVVTGNPTVDATNTGGPITIVYYYRVLPTNVANLGAE